MLLLKISQKGSKLNEALILVKFVKKCEEAIFWINDKTSQLNLDDFRPQDIEHVEVYQKKFDELVKDTNGEELRINTLNEHADKLVAEEHQDSAIILSHKNQVNEAFDSFKRMMNERNDKLSRAHEIRSFDEQAIETLAWITDKNDLLSINDYGKDLVNVKALQRRHETIERDLAAVEVKVDNLCE